MRKLGLLSALLTTILFAEFKTIDVAALEKMQAAGVPVIDIRTPGEWKETGIIKGAHTIMFFTPRGEPDTANWFFQLGHLIQEKNAPLIIYCAHANRTKALGKGLEKMGFSHIYELRGGIENGWIKAGKPTIKK